MDDIPFLSASIYCGPPIRQGFAATETGWKNKVGNCHDSHDDNRAGNDHNSVVNQFFLRRPDDFFSSAFTPRAKLPFASFFLFFCAFFDAVAAI